MGTTKSKNGDMTTRFGISKKEDNYAIINGGGTPITELAGLDHVLIELKVEEGRHILCFTPYNGQGASKLSRDKTGTGWHLNVPAKIAPMVRNYTGFNYKKFSKSSISNPLGTFYKVAVDLDDRTEDEVDEVGEERTGHPDKTPQVKDMTADQLYQIIYNAIRDAFRSI